MCERAQVSQKHPTVMTALRNHQALSGTILQHGYITKRASKIYRIFWSHYERCPFLKVEYILVEKILHDAEGAIQRTPFG